MLWMALGFILLFTLIVGWAALILGGWSDDELERRRRREWCDRMGRDQ